jgi:hypothetical protein
MFVWTFSGDYSRTLPCSRNISEIAKSHRYEACRFLVSFQGRSSRERPIFLQYRVTTKGSYLSNEATRFLEAINENVSGRSYRSGTSERFLVLRNTRGHMCISCRNSSSEQLALNED